MGNSCTHAADAMAHLVTEDEIQEAVKCIDEWQKTQQAAAKGAIAAQNTYGPLLQRVGGPDVVKQVVELFYRKLYADPRLITFLYDQDVMHLRAKQSAFISWLFGPPNMPYVGRSVRIAHLRIIKQRGFGPEDYDLGMRYFEEAMKELGAPESILGEVMRRLVPFKDAFFTPSARDAEEEARWAAEDRAREEEEEWRRQQEQQQQQQARQFLEQVTMVQRAVRDAALAEAAVGAMGAGTDAVTEVVAEEAVATGTAEPPRPASRGPQCPFTAGRLSRPTSAAAASVAVTAVPLAAAPPTADPTPLPGRATPKGSPSAPNRNPGPDAAAAAKTAAVGGGGSRPGTQLNGSRTPAAPAAPAVQFPTPSAAAPPPPPPPPLPASAPLPVPVSVAGAAAAAPMEAPPPPPLPIIPAARTAPAVAAPVVPAAPPQPRPTAAADPMSDFDAMLSELEQVIRQSNAGAGQHTPRVGA